MQYLSCSFCLGRWQLMFRPPDRVMTPTPHSCSPPLMASCWNEDRGPFDRAWLSCPSGLHQRSSTLFSAFASRRWVPPPSVLFFCLHLTDRYRNHCIGGEWGGDRSQGFFSFYRIWDGGMECRWLKNGRKGRDAKHLQKAFFPTSSFEASLHIGMSFRKVGKPQQSHFPPERST